MSFDDTFNLLNAHQTPFPEEQEFLLQTLSMTQSSQEDFWKRSRLAGHITASAWVVNREKTAALLIHHTALDRWFQPGGHVEEGDLDLVSAARRELQEECHLGNAMLLSPDIFDLDVHLIPAKKDVPEHLHYDVRFLFEAPSEYIPDTLPDEIKGLKWVDISSLTGTDTPQSLRRMALKTLARGCASRETIPRAMPNET
ncbi:MAG: NUDIX hydrolase [Saprospiraceae bacterium]|nr:NUDIX hydrolase [Saprospiraceae bacterium]